MAKKKLFFWQHKELYQEVFGTPSGKLILNELANKFHMMGATRSSDDKPGDMEYREGARNVILYILKHVDFDLVSYRNQRAENQLEIINDR